MQANILGAFLNSVWSCTPILEHSHLSVPVRRITDEFMNIQHLLNLASVSKRWQKRVIQVASSTVTVTNALDNMKTA